MNEHQLALEMHTPAPREPEPVKRRRVPKALKTARQATDEAIAKASEHADQETPEWTVKAAEWVRVYAIENKRFMCEAVRVYAEGFNFPPPPDKHSWGNAMRRAARKGHVFKLGLSYATDPRVHQNAAGLWESLVFKGPTK